jgi:hypothetical protein
MPNVYHKIPLSEAPIDEEAGHKKHHATGK